MKRWKKIVLGIVTTFVVLLGLAMYAPFTFRTGSSRDDYSNVIGQSNLSGDTRIVDIAMLGAHDAFSSNIGLKSKPDPAESGIVASNLVNKVFKGGLVRVLRAQNSSAEVLLKRGVRYFDVRVSYADGEWYTKHGLLDDLFANHVSDVYEFLANKPDEFIIFDVQHIYTGEKTISDFLKYFQSLALKDSGLSLVSFLNYTTNIPVGELTYYDVKGTTHGGIVFLLNDDGSATFDERKLFYSRGDGEDMTSSLIRSKWHNQTNLSAMILLIDEEANYLNSLSNLDFFRVNQAQLTPDYVKDPFGTLWGWSLINIAAKSNRQLLNHANFDGWLKVMPIFMVDFANSNSGQFNKKINEKIIAYNRALTA